MADLADEDDRVALPLQNVLLGVVLLHVERHRLVVGLWSQSSLLNAHTLSRPQGVVRGGSGLPNFLTLKRSVVSTNAQLRFASVVLGRVLGPSHLARQI